MSGPNKMQAKAIIESVGASGLPPEYGFEYFTAGLDQYLKCIDSEYLDSFVKEGGAAFKLVKGVYGGGKTHFLYCVRQLAWKQNFGVAYVTLSPDSTPFFKLELVYKEIANSITLPLTEQEIAGGYEKGMSAVLQRYFMSLLAKYEALKTDPAETTQNVLAHVEHIQMATSISYTKAIKTALVSLARQDDSAYESVCQWLNGEGYVRKIHGAFGILEKIDRATAFKMIRSLAQTLRFMDYSGLVILFDEAEQKSSMSTKQRGILQSNLRELIDACGHTNFPGVMIFYAVPDLSFLEGTTQVYEALKQRLTTIYSDINPTGIQIDLEAAVKDPIKFLKEVGAKLAGIYEQAYECTFDRDKLRQTVAAVADQVYKERFGDTGYKRLFAKRVIEAFHFLRNKNQVPTATDMGSQQVI